MSVLIDVRNGAIYLPVAVVDTYFPNIDSVIVLIRERQLCILPVHQMAVGGCLLKIRNAVGDRVVGAHDVLAANGLDGWSAKGLIAQWSRENGALLADIPHDV